jgi:hypothetical protein
MYPTDLPTTSHPLPLGMPIYKLILGRTQAFAILSQSADDYLPYQYVDFDGTCVAKFIQLLEIAAEFLTQNCYLSCPETVNASQPPAFDTETLKGALAA